MRERERERRNCLVFRCDSALGWAYKCLSFKTPGIQVLQRFFLQLISGNLQKTKPASHDAERTGCPVLWLPLHVALLQEELIPIKWFCHSPLTNSALLTRLEQEMFQQNKIQLVMRKNNHAALASFSRLLLVSCLGFHTRPDRSHLPSHAKVSEAGKHVFVSFCPFERSPLPLGILSQAEYPPWLGEGGKRLTSRLVSNSCHISKRGARCLATPCLGGDDFGSHRTIQVFPQFSPETEGTGICLRRHGRYQWW